MLFLAWIALAATSRASLRPSLGRMPRAVFLAYAAWALLAAASLAWSVQPRYTFSELRAEVLYGGLALGAFFFAAQDASRWRRWWIALMAGSLAVLAAQLVQELLPFALTRHSAFEQRGPWSTHLVLIAPLLFVIGWPRPWGEERGVPSQAIALAALLAAAWVTDNRMVWAAFGAQLVVAIALWRSIPTMEALQRRGLRRLALAGIVLVAVAFAASIAERSERQFAKDAPATISVEKDLRPRIWAVAWKQVRQAPWLGHGFGRDVLAPVFEPLTPRVLNHPPVMHGHNVFVNVALQLGLVGLAVFVAMLLALANEYRAFLRRAAIAPLGVLGLVLLAGFVVKNLTDDFVHRHNALVFWALNGILLGLGRAAGAAGEKD